MYDWNGDDNIEENENTGIAFTVYQNTSIGTSDSLRVFILDPDDQTEYLFLDTLSIETQPIELLVSSANSFSTFITTLSSVSSSFSL